MSDKADILESLRAQMARMESTGAKATDFSDTDEQQPRRTSRRGASAGKKKAASVDSAFGSELAEDEENEEILSATGSHGSERPARTPEDVSEDGAFNRMVDLISHAMRTEQELRRRLIREGYPATSVMPALARAKACGLVNDEVFAEQFTLARRARSMGFDRIRRDLLAKGIDPSRFAFWQELQDESSAEDQFAEALDYGSRHIPSSKHPGRSLYAALIRRGYPASIASRVVRELGLNLYE